MPYSVWTDENLPSFDERKKGAQPTPEQIAEASVGGFLRGREPAVPRFVNAAGYPASRLAASADRN